MIHTAIILAGGFGTRLREVLHTVPKPMAPVNGKPFLHYLLRYLKHYGIREVVISTGHMADQVRELGTSFEGMQLRYSHEESPLGTGGAIRLALQHTSEQEVLVMNGDSFADTDLNALYRFHAAEGSAVTLVLRKVDKASRYGEVKLDNTHAITAFEEKKEGAGAGLINAGVYLLNKDVFLAHTQEGNFSVEKEFFASMAGKGTMKGWETKGYFIDIGIPEDYKRAQDEFKGFAY